MFSPSMLAILEACGEIDKGDVLGIDIENRPHNKNAILKLPMSKKITMFEGSSINEYIIARVKEFAKSKSKILICLDSNHIRDYVLTELRAYTPLVSIGSYCIVGGYGY